MRQLLIVIFSQLDYFKLMGTVVQLKKSINNSYSELKSSVEDKLFLVEEKIKTKLLSKVELVDEMTKYHLRTGGKRLRALLTLISAKICGYTKGSRDINLAACVELIHAATNAVQNDLGRCLIETTYTLYLDKWPGREIQLPYPPLLSVTHIKYYGDATETLDTLSTDDYTVSTSGDPGVVWLNEDKDWPDLMDRPTPIEIKFKAGYGSDADDVPAAIAAAVTMTAAYFFDQPLPVITGTIATELPLGVSRLIDSERFQRY